MLGELEYERVAFTHGTEITDGAREAVRGFLAEVAVPEPVPLILSAVLDAPVQRARRPAPCALPAERNHLDAHVTLFHHLPGAEWTPSEAVDGRARCPAPTVVTGVRSLGRGWRCRSPRPGWHATGRLWSDRPGPRQARPARHGAEQGHPRGGPRAARRAGRGVRRRAHAGGRARAVALPRRPVGARRAVRVRRGRTRPGGRFREQTPGSSWDLRHGHREPDDDHAITEPTVLDVAERSRFEIHVDGRLAGFAQYRMKDPGLIVFTHTEIDDAYEGRGLGSILVRAALDAARGRGLAVRPDCPFVRAYIARHPRVPRPRTRRPPRPPRPVT